MLPTSKRPLYGREAELHRLVEILDSLRDGHGATVVIRGEPGIGKTALLTELSSLAVARETLILTAAGVESEAEMAFAGLHQLLRPVLGLVDRLPGVQRTAVLAAFGMTDAPAADRFLTGLATLNLLAEAAAGSPAVLIVEDAHWIDRASAEVLAFVARRLESEPIALLAATRDGFDGPFDDRGLPQLPLARLEPAAASALLDARSPAPEPGVRARLLREAAGNPLALVELPVAAAGADAGGWLPLTARLEQAFGARMSGLPRVTQIALRVAALADEHSLPEVLDASSAVAGVDVRIDDLTPAAAVGLIHVDDEGVQFRHPLMRSAIHQLSSVAERRAAHAALAGVPHMDEDRRVWHRAAACAGVNDEVATELDAVAARAQRRGGTVAAVAALERAAALTPSPARRRLRLVRAAELASELGRRGEVVRLLDMASLLAAPAELQSRVAWIRASFHEGLPVTAAGTRLAAQLAERAVADGDTELALRVLRGAAVACFWADPGPAARSRLVEVAESVPTDGKDARLLAILAFAAPIERGSVVLERLRDRAGEEFSDAPTARLLGDAASAVGAYDLAVHFTATAIDDLRSQGRLGLVARARTTQAWSAAHLVDLSVAIPAAEESSRLAQETSQPLLDTVSRSAQAILAALRGDLEGTERLTAEAEQRAVAVGASAVLAAVQIARGLAALGAGGTPTRTTTCGGCTTPSTRRTTRR